MRNIRERGAVLVETALIVSTALTLMLFTVDVGILGFMQVSADAAAFFDAHENVIGLPSSNTGTPENYTAGLFPAINSGDMTTSVIPAPVPSVAVNYGYNPPAGQTANPNSAQNRYGGVSMMQPVQLQVMVSPKPVFDIAGQRVGVSSKYIEPKWTECGPHYNVANENFACGDPSAPPNSAVAPGQGEVTPPYYVGYNLMLHCEDDQPWGDAANGGNATCQNTNFLALGVASYLDTDNWSNLNPGVSGAVGTSVFHAAAFHQRVYANIAQFFSKYPDLFPLYQDYSTQIETQLGITYLGQLPKTFNNDQNWTAFAIPNSPNLTKIDPGYIDEAIQCVYGWDQIIASGFPPGTYKEPGQYPLHPERACPLPYTP